MSQSLCYKIILLSYNKIVKKVQLSYLEVISLNGIIIYVTF